VDLVEAIKSRRSIRVFKKKAVPKTILKKILGLSIRSSSWGNTQPWEFIVVRGKKLGEVKKAFIQCSHELPDADLKAPAEFPEPLALRRRVTGIQVLQTMGIGREDKERREWWRLQGLQLFQAPAVIYILIDRDYYFQKTGINVWPVFDCGLLAQNIMLLANNFGLGTVAQAQAVIYCKQLRQILDIPDSKLLVIGIAIGYPEEKASINKIRTDREPIENLVRWL